MEALIHHFKLYTEAITFPPVSLRRRRGAQRSEFGAYIVADGTNKPYRCRSARRDLRICRNWNSVEGPRAGRRRGDRKVAGYRFQGDRPVSEQPREFSFTPEMRAKADAIIAKYPEGRQRSAVVLSTWPSARPVAGCRAPRSCMWPRFWTWPRIRVWEGNDLLHDVQSQAGQAHHLHRCLHDDAVLAAQLGRYRRGAGR